MLKQSSTSCTGKMLFLSKARMRLPQTTILKRTHRFLTGRASSYSQHVLHLLWQPWLWHQSTYSRGLGRFIYLGVLGRLQPSVTHQYHLSKTFIFTLHGKKHVLPHGKQFWTCLNIECSFSNCDWHATFIRNSANFNCALLNKTIPSWHSNIMVNKAL